MARNPNPPSTLAVVRHAVDCPGGPWCYCGVTGLPRATLRQALPRPVVAYPATALPRPAVAVALPRPLAK